MARAPGLIMTAIRPNMYNMSYSSPNDKKLKLLDIITQLRSLPSQKGVNGDFDIEVLSIKGRDRKLQTILTLDNEYGLKVINNDVDSLIKNEMNANKPIVIPNFKQQFNEPNENENLTSVFQKAKRLKKIAKRKDPEILKAKYIKEETRKRQRQGVRSIDFKLRITKNNDTSGVSFTVFRNGSMRASGGFLDVEIATERRSAGAVAEMKRQVKVVHTFLVEKYKIPSDKLDFNNITASFNVNTDIPIKSLVQRLPPGKIKKANLKKRPRIVGGIAIIPLGDVTLRLTSSGKCQISNVTDPSSLWNAYSKIAYKYIRDNVKGPYRQMANRTTQSNSPSKITKRVTNTAAPEVLKRGTTCPKSRCPEPYSFQGKCPKKDQYVRPNPQGQPCCYKIPKNATYIQNKVKNAYKRANVKVPNAVKNIFNVPNRVNGRNNTTSSSNQNFIRTHNDPTITNAYITNMNRLLNAYKAKRKNPAGLWIIKTVRGDKFEFPMKEEDLIKKARGRADWYEPDVSKFMIRTRQCTRYTKVGLYDIAKRLGLTSIKPNMKKTELCHIIRKKVRGTVMNTTKTASAGGLMAVTVKDTGKRGDIDRAITGKDTTLRIGARDAATFPIDKLLDFARQLGMRGPIPPNKTTVIGIISELSIAKKNALKTNLNKREANRKAAEEARIKANEEAMAKRAANNAASREAEYDDILKQLLILDKKGRGTYTLVSGDLRRALNLNKDVIRSNVATIAKNAVKRAKLRAKDVEKTAKGELKGIAKRFISSITDAIEDKYMKQFLNSQPANVRTFATTIPAGKKRKPTLKAILSYANKIKKKAAKK